ncbi:hypothetical protein SCANM63S_01249 [Streptomyces canarius]
MTLPSPNLDDRRFQQLVDEAKRLVQQRCPEWTDHNVSDPGVTLIEAFATMVDQLVYRLNRVPDKNYLAFLDLIGVRLYPPTAARTEATFWLSAPQPDTVRVAAGTEVAGAVALHRTRGTRAGLAAAIRAETGIEPEISESGATSWSSEPGSALPGSARPWVRVRLRLPDARALAPTRARLEKLMADEVPAHVGYEVEVLTAEEAGA